MPNDLLNEVSTNNERTEAPVDFNAAGLLRGASTDRISTSQMSDDETQLFGDLEIVDEGQQATTKADNYADGDGWDNLSSDDRQRLAGYLAKHFDEMDANNDGQVSPGELGNYCRDHEEDPESGLLKAYGARIAKCNDDWFVDINITWNDVDALGQTE